VRRQDAFINSHLPRSARVNTKRSRKQTDRTSLASHQPPGEEKSIGCITSRSIPETLSRHDSRAQILSDELFARQLQQKFLDNNTETDGVIENVTPYDDDDDVFDHHLQSPLEMHSLRRFRRR